MAYAIPTAPVFNVTSTTPGGGSTLPSGVAEPWARIAGDAEIYAERKIATAVREAVGTYLVTRDEPATVSPTGKIEMGCLVTISGVAGDGSAGSSPYRAFDTYSVIATDATSTPNWGYSELINNIIVFGEATDDLWKHDLANFLAAPVQVDANAQPIAPQDYAGCVSREGKYAYISGKAGDSSALRVVDLTTNVLTSFGGTVDRYAYAAEDNAGSPAVYVQEAGPVLKRYNPNIGTVSLGAAVWSNSIDVSGRGQIGTFDDEGNIWFQQGGNLYQVRKDSGTHFLHRYPEELGGVSVGGNSRIAYDRLRRRLYMALAGSDQDGIYEYKNYSGPGLAHSGVWQKVVSLPLGMAFGASMYYDETEDVLFVIYRQGAIVARYAGDPKTLIDIVSVDDLTGPDNPQIDYDLDTVVTAFYRGQYGYAVVLKSTTQYVLRISYKGSPITITGLGARFTRPINWAYEIVSTTQARIFTYLNQSPPLLVDCEFTVSLPDLSSGGTGTGGSETVHLFMLPFAFGDATPAVIGTIAAGKQILSVNIYITTPFNGTGAALSVGTSGSPSDLMAVTENAPGTVGEYSIYTQKSYGSNTALYLHITPGSGASAGSGLAVIEFQP